MDRLSDAPDLRIFRIGGPELARDVPERFGAYRVEAEIGRGGMGVVYRAVDDELLRTVAVKVLKEADADAQARFVREARAAAQIAHENVVRVFAVVSPPDAPPYLVLEYIDGPTLRRHANETRGLDPRTAAELCAQVADGLAAAHAAGLVHRDVKPANVLLAGARGKGPGASKDSSELAPCPLPLAPKVADFGLARATADPAGFTRSGVVVGTPAYMAPEQVLDPSRADHRADVYGLGATLYECLTGVEPYRGSVQLVLSQVLEADPVAPRRLKPDIPLDLETICLKAMAKEPGRRYQTMIEFRDDLRRWLHGEPIAARPVGRVERAVRWAKRNPRVAGLAATVMVVFLAGFAGVTWQWQRADSQRRRAEANYLRACEALHAWIHGGELHMRTAHGLSADYRAALDMRLRNFRAAQEATDGPDPATEFAVAATQMQIGLHATESGRPAEAEAAFREAADIFDRAAAANPDHVIARGQTTAVRLYLGELYLHVAGQPDEAAIQYRLVLASFRQLAAESPDDPWLERNQALGRYLIAATHLVRRDYAAARTELDAARAILDGLIAADPHNVDYRRRLATVDQFDGEYLLRTGDPAKAVEYLSRSRAVRAEVARERSWDILFQRDMARVDQLLGEAELARGNLPAATAALTRARATLEPLARDNPNLPLFRRALAGVLFAEAELHRAAGRPADAAKAQDAAQAILERLTREFPDVPVFRTDRPNGGRTE